jgi:hypothetical protein
MILRSFQLQHWLRQPISRLYEQYPSMEIALRPILGTEWDTCTVQDGLLHVHKCKQSAETLLMSTDMYDFLMDSDSILSELWSLFQNKPVAQNYAVFGSIRAEAFCFQ